MIKGKTTSGFSYEIEEAAVNDYRLLKLIARAEENKYAITEIVTRLLGEKQEEKLMKHLEDSKGRVDLDLLDKEIAEMFNGAKEIKNS